jgi:hypothetical protein
VGRN